MDKGDLYNTPLGIFLSLELSSHYLSVSTFADTQLHCLACTVPKISLCIPRKGIVWPQPQFLHSCVCKLFIYSQDWFTYFAAAK
jgi:hypothetical protein